MSRLGASKGRQSFPHLPNSLLIEQFESQAVQAEAQGQDTKSGDVRS